MREGERRELSSLQKYGKTRVYKTFVELDLPVGWYDKIGIAVQNWKTFYFTMLNYCYVLTY